MASGRVKGTGRTHNRSFWPFRRATGSAATIDTRRAETQSGSAAPQAQESVTRQEGGGRPNLRGLIYNVPEVERLTNEPARALQRLRQLS
jgi:hypothetical protein